MTFQLSACSSLDFLNRTPGSVGVASGHPPDVGASLDYITKVLKNELHLSDHEIETNYTALKLYPRGHSAVYGEWAGNEYYPAALGGFARKPGSMDAFEERMKPFLAAEKIKSKSHDDIGWSDFCGDSPEICREQMRLTCEAEKKTKTESSVTKIRKGLEAGDVSFSSRDFNDQVDCDVKVDWSAGSCGTAPYVQSLFPRTPREKTRNGVNYTQKDLEVAAYLLLEEVNTKAVLFSKRNGIGDSRASGQKSEGVSEGELNPASFLYFMMNAYGKNSGQFLFSADIDESSEVWNYLVRGYQVASMLEVNSPAEVQKLYDRAREFSTYPVKPNADATKFFKIDFTVEYASTSGHYSAVIEVNRTGQMIGGEWLQQNRPNFIWYVKSVQEQLMEKVEDRPDLQFLYHLIVD
jgi:hypothetical protein